ncbi:MAG: RHS repeat-associated core domain-containing protein [Verrucomicrobiota bacterium]
MKTLLLSISLLLAAAATCHAGGAGQSIGSFSNWTTSASSDGGYEQIDTSSIVFSEVEWDAASVSLDLDIDWTQWQLSAADEDYVDALEAYNSAVYRNTSLGILDFNDYGMHGSGEGATIASMVGDPVNPVTGDFYVDTVDLALRGPIPLEIRRNYFSRTGGVGAFGYGWKRSLTPFLVFPDRDSGDGTNTISATEMDGTVINYSKVTTSELEAWNASTSYDLNTFVSRSNKVWKSVVESPSETPGQTNGTEWLEIELWRVKTDLAVSDEVNSGLSNFRPVGVGGLSNLYAQRIEKTNESSINVYRLYGSDGSLRTFEDDGIGYPIGSLDRVRPYLKEWKDNRGNTLSFEFGENEGRWDYGQLIKVQCSNGAFLGFEYNSSGLVTDAYTNDGRRLKYIYDENADLVQVLRPDNSVVKYDYELRTDDGSGEEYSAHLIIRVIKPDGRILENDYDDERRVTEQRATVGQGTQLERIATFVYDHTEEGDSLSGWTRVYDYNDTPTGSTPQDAANDTNCTLYEYTNELITLTRDPLGTQVEQAWYTERYDIQNTSTQKHTDPNDAPDSSGVIADETDFTGFGDNSPGGYPRSLKWRKDKRGLITYFWYDSRGNIIQQKTVGDLDGLNDGIDVSTTLAEYDALNLITYARDESGIETRTFYEDSDYPYLPTRVEVSEGGTLISAARNSYTEVDDSETGFFTRGLLEQTSSGLSSANSGDSHPDAAHQKFTYDHRGYATSQTSYTITSGWDPTPDVALDPVSEFFYNYRNELVETKFQGATGTTTTHRFSYDGRGRRTWSETYDSAGALLSRAEVYYNGNGEVTWENGPKADPEDYVFRDYDGAGRIIAELRWKSQAASDGSGVEVYAGDDILDQPITTYEYDKFGNLRKQTDPRGHYKLFEYDALGQLTKLECFDGDSGELLTTERYEYEAGHQLSKHVNARGGITLYFYNSRGQLTEQQNPDGTILYKTYYLDGRLEKDYLANGNYWLTTYDDANRTMTRTFYNADNSIHIDPASSLTVTEVTVSDRRGNVVSTTDRGGYISTQTYDGLSRPLVATTLNAAEAGFSAEISVTQAYSKDGLLVWTENALGELSLSQTDSLGRIVSERVYDTGLAWAANDLPTTSPVRLTSYKYDPNHHWVESVAGDPGSSDPLVHQKVYSDTWGQPVLSINRGSAGDRFQLTRYDLAGNRVLFQDYMGQRTRYEWDGLNRLHKTTLPDGATTEFVYNDAGEMVSRIMPGGMTEQIRYDLAGRTRESWLENKGQKTRERSFEYYTSNTPYVGLLKTSKDLSRGLRSDYTSFDAFNRVLVETHSGNTDIQGYTTTATYDRRGVRTSVTRDYISAAYEDTSVSWLTDGHGQLYQETIQIAAATHSSYQQKWDAAGRRTELLTGELGDAVQRYVFDHDPDGYVSSNTVHTSGGSEAFSFGRGTSGLLSGMSSSWATSLCEYNETYDAGRLAESRTTLTNGIVGTGDLVALQSWRVDGLRSKTGFYESGRTNGNNTVPESAMGLYTYNARGQLTHETVGDFLASSYFSDDAPSNPFILPDWGPDFPSDAWPPLLDPSLLIKIDYGFDASKLGVLRRKKHLDHTLPPFDVLGPHIPSGTLWSIPATGLDRFARMHREAEGLVNVNTTEDFASGSSSGASNVIVSLTNLSTGVETTIGEVEFNPDAADGAWSAPLDLAPGQYELSATPVDKSGSVIGETKVSRFERSPSGNDQWTNSVYDEQGYTKQRQNQDGVTQTLIWDSNGRLLRLTTLDSSNNGFEFTATYDPLGRRLKVEYKSITSGTTAPSGDLYLSTFDPQILYMEVSVSLNDARTWKIYGPDLNGSYGGLHGIGGLCAAYLESLSTYFPLMLDTLGNVVAHIESGVEDRIVYGSTNTTAYGVASEPPPKEWGETDSTSVTTKLWEASAWRGYRYDPTGYIHMGARCYDPVSGRFLSPDPLGHAESMDLYSFANGDPINFVDPTGRGGELSSYAFSPMGDFGNFDEQPYVRETGWDVFKDGVANAWSTTSGYVSDFSFHRVGNNMKDAAHDTFVGGWEDAKRNAVLRGEKVPMIGAVMDYSSNFPVVGAFGQSYNAAVDLDEGNYGSAALNYASVGLEVGGVGLLDDALRVPARYANDIGASGRALQKFNATNRVDDVVRTNFNQYEAIFEAPISGTTRGAHRTSANNFLADQLGNSPQLRSMFDAELGTDVLQHMNSGAGRNFLNPPGAVWHHPIDNPNVMQLLRTGEHTNPMLQPVLHPGPNGTGGFGTFF